jgi:hypothetical protein
MHKAGRSIDGVCHKILRRGGGRHKAFPRTQLLPPTGSTTPSGTGAITMAASSLTVSLAEATAIPWGDLVHLLTKGEVLFLKLLL